MHDCRLAAMVMTQVCGTTHLTDVTLCHTPVRRDSINSMMKVSVLKEV